MMKPEIEKLIAEVDEYLAATGMAASTFGRKAVNDGKCVERLRDGGRAWPETVDKIRQFIAANPPKAKDAAA